MSRLERLPCLIATAAALAVAAAPTSSLAQTAQNAPAGERLVLLGTAGGPPAHSTRSQPANMLQIGARTYLIDSGQNAAQQALRAGVPAQRIDALFITHLHWDHTLGLGYLMATGWMLGRSAPMLIYGPPGIADYVGREVKAVQFGEDIFRAQSPDRPPLASLYAAREVDISEPREIFRDDQVRVTAVANSHFAQVHGGEHAYGPDKSYSYRFDSTKGSVVFTGDTGPSEAVNKLAEGADILVAEIVDVDSILAAMKALNPNGRFDMLATHMKQQHLAPEEVGKMAAAAGVKKLVLSHYVMGQNVDPASFVPKIRPFFSGEIVVGQDLMVIALGGR